jgi:hypothetical protein
MGGRGTEAVNCHSTSVLQDEAKMHNLSTHLKVEKSRELTVPWGTTSQLQSAVVEETLLIPSADQPVPRLYHSFAQSGVDVTNKKEKNGGE